MSFCDLEEVLSMMSETEQRRRQLLRQVKGSGQFSGRNIPAIHPRYTSAYHSIYESGNITEKGTFQLAGTGDV